MLFLSIHFQIFFLDFSNSTAALTRPSTMSDYSQININLHKPLQLQSSEVLSSTNKTRRIFSAGEKISSPLPASKHFYRSRGTSLGSSFLCKPTKSTQSRWKPSSRTHDLHIVSSPTASIPPPLPSVPPPSTSEEEDGDVSVFDTYSLGESDYEEANPLPPQLPPRQSGTLSKWRSHVVICLIPLQILKWL